MSRVGERYKKKIRKAVSFLLLVAICCSFVVVPAGATDVTGEIIAVSYAGWVGNSNSSSISPVVPSTGLVFSDITYPRTGSNSIFGLSSSTLGSGYISSSTLSYAPYSFDFGLSSYFSGAVGIYLSFFYVYCVSNSSYFDYSSGSYIVSGSDFSDSSYWTFLYDDEYGRSNVASSDGLSVSTFTPVSGISSGYQFPDTVGYQLSYSFSLEDGVTILPDRFLYSSSNNYRYFQVYNNQAKNNRSYVLGIVIPSASVVVTETAADLAALEGIADGIAQTNNVLSAMYGDIMSVLNSIYQRTGDMLAAQQLTNQYLVSMSNYLQQIAGNTSNIYTLLSTYMHYLQEISETADDIYAELQAFHSTFLLKVMELIETVQTESDDIQAKMEELYERLEEWLNTAFQDAVNEDLAGEVEGVQGDMSQSESIESGVTGSMSSAFAGLDLSGFSFSSGMIAGISYVSNTWTSFYNSLGDYQIIVLLPLYIGVGLLVLGYSHKIIVHASRKKDGGG